MKAIFVFFILIFSLNSFADEQAYTRSNVSEYLSVREAVYVVVKIAGDISYSQYNILMSEYSDKSEDYLFEQWKKIPKQKKDEFLVLNSLKGDAASGSVINATELGSTLSVTDIGGQYIIFFSRSNKGLTYGQCDSIEISHRSLEKFNNLSEIINHISKSNFTVCLGDKVKEIKGSE